jgi:hypothetical protein
MQLHIPTVVPVSIEDAADAGAARSALAFRRPFRLPVPPNARRDAVVKFSVYCLRRDNNGAGGLGAGDGASAVTAGLSTRDLRGSATLRLDELLPTAYYNGDTLTAAPCARDSDAPTAVCVTRALSHRTAPAAHARLTRRNTTLKLSAEVDATTAAALVTAPDGDTTDIVVDASDTDATATFEIDASTTTLSRLAQTVNRALTDASSPSMSSPSSQSPSVLPQRAPTAASALDQLHRVNDVLVDLAGSDFRLRAF